MSAQSVVGLFRDPICSVSGPGQRDVMDVGGSAVIVAGRSMNTFKARWNRLFTSRMPVRMKINHSRAPLASFSFDDFPRSAWTIGGEVLRRHGVRATFYTVAGFAGRAFEGIEQHHLEDLHEVLHEGHEIGGHTFDHKRVYDLSTLQIMGDETKCKDFFATHIPQATISSFAYPYGEVSPRTKLVYSRLYPTCRGIRRGVNGRIFDASQLRAVSLESKSWERHDIEAVIHEAVAKRAWLIFFTHDVTADPAPFGVRPDMLEYAIETLKGLGVEILPVSEAYARTQRR